MPEITINDSLLDDLDRIIIEAIAKGWREEGHELTGKFIEGIKSEKRSTRDGIVIDYKGAAYGLIQNFGVKPDKIPYKRGSGAGESLYIKGLINYVKKRMAISSAKETKSVAFAIAETQKKKGMQIRTLGQGTGWAEKVAEDVTPEVSDMMALMIEDFVITDIKKLANEFNARQ